MSDADRPGPSPVVIGAGGILLVLVLALAALSSGEDMGRLTDAQLMEGAVPTASAYLEFRDRGDGSVSVLDAETGREVHRLPVGGGTFERGALRALVRQRKVHGVKAPRTFRLTSWRGGRLTLSDPATGTLIDLGAFGPTNAGAFARILDAATAPRAAGARTVLPGRE